LLFGASSIDRLRHFGQFLGRNYAGVDIIGVGVVGVNGDALAVVLNTPLSTLRRFAAKMSLLILLPNPLPFPADFPQSGLKYGKFGAPRRDPIGLDPIRDRFERPLRSGVARTARGRFGLGPSPRRPPIGPSMAGRLANDPNRFPRV
jgi:hypothetical protein